MTEIDLSYRTPSQLLRHMRDLAGNKVPEDIIPAPLVLALVILSAGNTLC